MRFGSILRWIAPAVLAVLPVSVGHADDVADFYKGKVVEFYIGYSAGGGYDTYARLIAKHLGKHIPGNPTVVPKNMPGGGSLKLTNWLYNVAPKDGTAIGSIGRGTGFDPLLGSKGAKFDATKFLWLGSANNEVSVCVAWHTSAINKFDDLYTKQLVVGGTGAAADTDQFPKILNGTLGTKFKIVTGYPGGNDVNLAMERGEVMGRCGWSWSSVVATRKDWLDSKKITVLVQLSLHKHADLPNTPVVIDLAKTDEQKKIFKLIFARQVMGRPYLAPPGIPKERAAALRKAFADTLKDKEFRADADQAKLEIQPVSGEEVEALVKEIYQAPKSVAEKAATIIRSK